ncbi:MAG: SDR family NAD(P)-dependent oxidoreductase [Planctomycetales bacterium]|nr:SDR family NAD(P)-dependent oxidoreductase [Planctomycetales bacterium]
MPSRDLSKLRILVTGASGGIGRELVKQLAKSGARVCFTARRADRIHALASNLESAGIPTHQIAYAVGDIIDSDVRRRLTSTCQDQFGGLDVLINNAGVGAVGPFADADPERLRRLFEVNVFAPIELVRCTLPLLRKGKTPAIVNVGSVLAHFAVPNKSEYCATKFALRGFTDSLRAEMKREGIDVISVHPNTTSSEFFDRLVEKKGKVAENPIQMPADVAARNILAAVSRGRAETVLSITGKLSVFTARLAPSIMRSIVRRFG